MKPFDTELGKKLANTDEKHYTKGWIGLIADLRRSLRLACVEIEYLRDQLKTTIEQEAGKK